MSETPDKIQIFNPQFLQPKWLAQIDLYVEKNMTPEIMKISPNDLR